MNRDTVRLKRTTGTLANETPIGIGRVRLKPDTTGTLANETPIGIGRVRLQPDRESNICVLCGS